MHLTDNNLTLLAASDYEGLISVLLENRSDVSTTLRVGRCYIQLIPVKFDNGAFEIAPLPTDGGVVEMGQEEEAVDPELESSQQLDASG